MPVTRYPGTGKINFTQIDIAEILTMTAPFIAQWEEETPRFGPKGRLNGACRQSKLIHLERTSEVY